MATIEELNAQSEALSQQAIHLSNILEKDVLGRARLLVEDQTNFVKSIALISGTLAPLSLLLLQVPAISPLIDINFLLVGFSVLTCNILYIFICLSILMLKRSRSNVSLLNQKTFDEIGKIGDIKQMTKTDEAVDSINHLLGIVSELQISIGNDSSNETRNQLRVSIYVRDIMIWGSLIFLGLGIGLILLSVWSGSLFVFANYLLICF